MPTAHRRLFLGSLLAGGVALAGKAAAGSLADHRIAKIEAKTSHDRYARYVGRNAKGNPAGRGFGLGRGQNYSLHPAACAVDD